MAMELVANPLKASPKIGPAGGAQEPLSVEQYRKLADFRYQLRRFLHFSKEAAESAGIHAQQYQLLQAVAGMPNGDQPTIAAVARRMCLRHNSAVELVGRTIEQGLLRKVPDAVDHRRLLLHVTHAGELLLESLVAYHLRELDELGPELIKSLRKVMTMRGDGRPALVEAK